MNGQPWTEKYKPSSSRDFAGNEEAIRILREWLEGWSRGPPRKRALLLIGPTGVGKTSAVYAVSGEIGYDVMEVNASDNRSKNAISQLLRTATISGSLVGKRGRVILIDELEGLSGTDRGATTALAAFIRETRVPMILITSDPTDRKITPLRRLCQIVEFYPVPKKVVMQYLERICRGEKIKYDREALEYLAELTNGDLRAAINDLQSVSKTEGAITIQAIRRVLSWRDRTGSIKETLDRIFYADTWESAIEAIRQADADPEELLRWITNNVPMVFPNAKSLSETFYWLSRSSIFVTRIRRTQNWGLLPYFMELMCVTKAIASTKPTPRRDYQFPEWIRQMGWSKRTRQIKREIGALLAPLVHTSRRNAYRDYILLLRELLTNKDTRSRVVRELDLSSDMVDFIIGSKRQK